MSVSKYLFIVSMNVKTEYEDLFNEVYDDEHVPYLLKVPGVNKVKRGKGEPFQFSIAGETKDMDAPHQKFVALYEIENTLPIDHISCISIFKMIIIDSPSLIETFIDKPLTPSNWFEVTQEKIDEFAKSTGDFQWIHVDIEKAKKEMPEGKTIAHGYFMVSLLPVLSAQTSKINNSSRTINYGSDKIRFINPVQVNSKVRLHRKIKKVNLMENGGYRVINNYEMEIDGKKKPAFVAETISLVFP